MDQKQKSQFFAEFMLATVTIFWGATFPIVKDAINEMPVMAFLWVRFAFAAVLLALIAGRSGTLPPGPRASGTRSRPIPR